MPMSTFSSPTPGVRSTGAVSGYPRGVTARVLSWMTRSGHHHSFLLLWSDPSILGKLLLLTLSWGNWCHLRFTCFLNGFYFDKNCSLTRSHYSWAVHVIFSNNWSVGWSCDSYRCVVVLYMCFDESYLCCIVKFGMMRNIFHVSTIGRAE